MRTAAALLVASCTSWQSRAPQALERDDEVLVIAHGEAHELTVSANDGKRLTGTPSQSWQFDQTKPIAILVNESPTDMASRLGWTATPSAPSLSVELSKVQHAKVREGDAGIVVVGAVIGSLVAGLLFLDTRF